MQYDEMMGRLYAADTSTVLPIWLISYNRAGTAPFLELMARWDDQSAINVVVRSSQWREYRQAYPGMTIHGLPDEEISNCGSARWGAADLAYMLGHDEVIMADDDVLAVRFLYEGTIGRGPNTGKPSSSHSGKAEERDVPDFQLRVLTLASQVAATAFQDDPRLVQLGLIKQHMSFDPRNQATMYQVNGGVTPRQLMVWNLARMRDAGVRLDLDAFGVHGEDIGLAATILAAGLNCGSIPSFVYDHWPEAVNIDRSMIRNRDNAAALHRAEWEALQQYPIVDYLRVKRSLLDGSYEWGDVNWARLCKLRGVPSKRVPWPDDPSWDLL